MTKTTRRPLILMAILVSAFLFGCGPKTPKAVPVRGKITLGGGAWPKPGTVNFTPVSTGDGTRPVSADFDADGNFQTTSFTPGDGLLPGKYKISVTCWETPPSMANPKAARSAVPVKYQNAATSDLELPVELGKPQTGLKLDVPRT